MGDKMKWDRVRKENLARRHGSEWVVSSVQLDRWKQNKRKKKRKQRRKRGHIAGPRMPGCTCGKPVGFSGEHKRGCPLRAPERLPVYSLSELATAIKAIRREKAVRDELSEALKTLGDNEGFSYVPIRRVCAHCSNVKQLSMPAG